MTVEVNAILLTAAAHFGRRLSPNALKLTRRSQQVTRLLCGYAISGTSTSASRLSKKT